MAALDSIEQAREKIARLEEALLSNNPGMPGMLREIHSALRADPENVTLLADEEIAVIVRGLMKQTKTVIAEKAVAKKTPRAKLANLDIVDL